MAARNGWRRRQSSSKRPSQRANVTSRPSRKSRGYDGAGLGGRGVGVACGEQVVDGELRHAAGREPRRGAAVSASDGDPIPLEHREQVLAQQRVIPEPATLRVEGDDELVGRREVAEDPTRARALDHRVAQAGRHPVEDRGFRRNVRTRGVA